MTPVILAAAYMMDLVLGDPRWLPHPVRLFGLMIGILDRLLHTGRRGVDLVLGAFVAVILPATAFLSSYYLLLIIDRYAGHTAWAAASIMLAWTTISVKGLADGARDVYLPLRAGNLSEARRMLGMIVGRDTAEISEQDIARGAVESVAENSSDGVVAPLFFLAIGGVPLAMAYKSINTLDSMIGYKNERYMYFGRASARLDDIVNFIPARLTGLLFILSSWLLSLWGMNYSWREAYHIFKRDSANHTSPNSGRPEAAAAGAMSIRLGGENSYFGVKSMKPYIGDPVAEIDSSKILDAIQLLYMASLIAALMAVLVRGAILLAQNPGWFTFMGFCV